MFPPKSRLYSGAPQSGQAPLLCQASDIIGPGHLRRSGKIAFYGSGLPE